MSSGVTSADFPLGTTPLDPAVDNVMTMVACLEQIKVVLQDVHASIADLQTIAKLQQARIEKLESTLRNPNRFSA